MSYLLLARVENETVICLTCNHNSFCLRIAGQFRDEVGIPGGDSVDRYDLYVLVDDWLS